MKLKPYLLFNGCAEEAANFYAAVFGGEIQNLHRYADCMPDVAEEYKNKVVHLCFLFDGNTIGIADVMPGTTSRFEEAGYSLTIDCDRLDQIEQLYDRLRADGLVKCTLEETFFAKRYAEVIDRFGVAWALMLEQ